MRILTHSNASKRLCCRDPCSAVHEKFKKGERSAERLIAAGLEIVHEEPAARLDYLSVVDPESLEPITDVTSRALVAVAAYVGNTRLIDNVVLE